MTHQDTTAGIPQVPDPHTGRVIADRLRLGMCIGTGGMARVYLAEQLDVGRTVVVKLLRPIEGGTLSASKGIIARFHREARAVARLNHPNIVQVHFFGETEQGEPYLVLEHIAGRPLDVVLEQEGPLDPRRTLKILGQIAEAMFSAHEAGIVHRDLKPGNVMLLDGPAGRPQIKVLDFGIAKMVEVDDPSSDGQTSPLTMSGEVFGTPEYVSPEQARGESVDARSDLYALGCVGYELLTGELVFEVTGKRYGHLVKHASEQPIPPALRKAELQIPREVNGLIMWCLEKSPDARPASAQALKAHIDALLATPFDEQSAPEPTARTEPDRPITHEMEQAQHPGRSKALWAAAAGVVIAGGITGAVLKASSSDNETPTPAPLAPETVRVDGTRQGGVLVPPSRTSLGPPRLDLPIADAGMPDGGGLNAALDAEVPVRVDPEPHDAALDDGALKSDASEVSPLNEDVRSGTARVDPDRLNVDLPGKPADFHSASESKGNVEAEEAVDAGVPKRPNHLIFWGVVVPGTSEVLAESAAGVKLRVPLNFYQAYHQYKSRYATALKYTVSGTPSGPHRSLTVIPQFSAAPFGVLVVEPYFDDQGQFDPDSVLMLVNRRSPGMHLRRR
ncbi:MAG: serine/threonine protein kinase [Bradymonadia bacterium]